MIPAVTKRTIDNYVEHGLSPGGFTHAVLANDLREAFGRADMQNRMFMFDIVTYCWNEIPSDCWGSWEKVKDWLEHRGLVGFENTRRDAGVPRSRSTRSPRLERMVWASSYRSRRSRFVS